MKVFYWQATDRVVVVHAGRMVSVHTTNYVHPQMRNVGPVTIFSVEMPRSRVAKLKTLIYLGEF